MSRIDELPPDLEHLERPCAAEGFAFLARLRRDWEEGTNRFGLPGESLFEARERGRLLGICGLNRDPYQADAVVGRVRHLYVLPEARGRGVGRRLVQSVLGAGRQDFSVVHVRTSTAEGDRFYRALGFEAVAGQPYVTHRLGSGEARVGTPGPR